MMTVSRFKIDIFPDDVNFARAAQLIGLCRSTASVGMLIQFSGILRKIAINVILQWPVEEISIMGKNLCTFNCSMACSVKLFFSFATSRKKILRANP